MKISFKYLFRNLLLALLLISCSALQAQQQIPDNDFKQQLRQAIADADQFEDRFAAQVWLTDMSYRLSKSAPDIPEKELGRHLSAM